MESAPSSANDLRATVSKTSLKEQQSASAQDTTTVPHDIEANPAYDPSSEQQHEETLIERLNLLRQDNEYRDLDERAYTLRKRIQEKLENAPKSVLEETEAKKSEIEKCLEKNDKELSDLLTFGEKIITNIKAASEKRELLRREFETNQRVDLENGISKETTEAMAHFDDIKARWSELETLEEPMILFDKMQAQKDAVLDLMRDKDELIAKCQNEMERINASFDVHFKQQQSELCSVVERVSAQTDLMKSAYGQRLNLLQDTLNEERQTVALKEQEKCKEFLSKAVESELSKLEATKKKKQFYSDEIRRITSQQEELTFATRIRLEKEAEMLLHELRCTKHRMLFDSEKLDYNSQVLQKRNEEIIIINNQQKRRVAKRSEAIVRLKAHIKSTEKQQELKIAKITKDTQKLHDSITDWEQKGDIFKKQNRKKLVRAWDVNFQELKSLIERVFDIDRILHEQQLGLPCQKPQLRLEEFDLVKQEKAALFGEPKSRKSECNSKIDEVSRQQIDDDIVTTFVLRKTKPNFRLSQRETLMAEEVRKLQEQRLEKRLLRNILRKIVNRGDFLLEDQLLDFLEPYTVKQKTLVRLDNIFEALHITDMPALNKLVEFFRPYAWCPNCMEGIPREHLKKLYRPLRALDAKKSSTDDPHDGEVDDDNNDEDDDDDDNNKSANDSNEASIDTNKASVSSSKELDSFPIASTNDAAAAAACDRHCLMVESAMVLTALSEFTHQATKEANKRLPSNAFSESGSQNSKTKSLLEIDDEVICAYWRKFLDYMPQEKLKLWKSLEHGLKHFFIVLKQREQLDKDCAALRQQNAELKHLTQKFKV